MLPLLGILVGLGNIACLIIVLTKLFPAKGVGMGIFGIICGLYTFVWGWQNADAQGIKNVMIVWSVLFALSIVFNVILRTTAGV